MAASSSKGGPQDARMRTIRARNRALLVVLVGLVALFYALTFVRMGGH
jgi:hypothetical protein